MSNVYYQHPGQKDPSFGIYIEKNESIQRFSVYESLKDVVKKAKRSLESSTLLLDNKYFSFFAFDIFRTVDKAFSVEDLEKLLAEKKFRIKINDYITAEFLASYVDSIYVNGEKKETLWGHKGNIFFRLYFIYIDDLCLNTIRSVVPDALTTMTIFPQSFYTMLFIRNQMQRRDFSLLYITKDAVKVVLVHNGFYNGVFSINLGISFLKKIYKDNDILQYWNMSEHDLVSNPVAVDLVTKSLVFYSEMLCKWLEEHGVYNTDIFLISSILKNGLFIDIFNTTYKKKSSANYIIPFHYSSLLKNFGKKWNPAEMDVLVYLNREEFVKNGFLETNIESVSLKGFTYHKL